MRRLRPALPVFGVVSLLALVLTVFPYTASGQNTDWPRGDKISQWVTAHQAAKTIQPGVTIEAHKQKLLRMELNAENLDAEECVIYVEQRLSDAEIAALSARGIDVNPHVWVPPLPGKHPYGYHLANVNYTSLGFLRTDDRFVFVESAEFRKHRQNDLSVQLIRADDVQAGNGMPGLDGTGINIGIADSGLDLSHPDIPTPIETYDMTDGTGPGDWDTNVANTVSGHGTHVTGTCVGSGGLSGGKYIGSAPGANLYFYKIDLDDGGGALDTDMIEAINRSVAVGCRIFSMSFGGWAVYNDGSDAVCQAIDAATAAGTVCFISAGNLASSLHHFSVNVAPGTTTGSFGLTVQAGSAPFNGPILLRLNWIDGIADNNMVLACSNLGGAESLNPLASGSSPRLTEAREYDLVVNLAANASKTYNLTLQNTAGPGSTPAVHIWSFGGVPGGGSHSFDTPDEGSTIASPALADDAIAVGSWVTRAVWTDYQGNNWTRGFVANQLAPYSSRGPRIDGVMKPDITASGDATISCRDSGNHISTGDPLTADPRSMISDDGVNDGSGPANYYIMGGTSMACPSASGATALLLEADPSLTPQEVHDALTSTASQSGAPDNDMGFGIIDIFEAICTLDDEAPVLTCPADITVECNEEGGVDASDPQIAAFLNGASATDNFDPAPVVTNNAPSFFDVGETEVTFTAEDGCGNASQCTRTVTVEDNTPPDLACTTDITVECSGFCGVAKDDPQLTGFYGAVSATDVCCGDVELTDDGPDCYPLGTTTVTFTATDCHGNESQCTADVTVVDTTPPEITVELDRYVLWPPNHKMADINATVAVTDVCCENPTFVLVGIWSNEPDNGKGDGNTVNDIQGASVGTSDVAFQLRSERSGGGDGRIYTIIYEAEDCVGNTARDTSEVRVPHDHAGWAFASTGFEEGGIGFDPALDEFVLVIPSTPAVYELDENGNEILVEAAFDATALDLTRTYVGNVKGVALPNESLEIDNDADGLTDLALYYSAPAVNVIIAASTAAEEGQIGRDESYGPIGLHYTSGGGVDYLVPDIFNLGPPVQLIPDVELRRSEEPGDGDEPRQRFDEIPGVTTLLSAYPNPFNPSTTIPFNLVTQEPVTLRIYNARGEFVRTLRDEVMPVGLHAVVWDGRDSSGRQVATGVYFVRLRAGAYQSTKKIVMLK